MNVAPGLSLLEKSLKERMDPPLEVDGTTRHVPFTQDTLAVLCEILHELRRLNSPWLAPKEIATYVGAQPNIVTVWKKAKLLTPHYFPEMANPRYLKAEVDALADRPPGIIRISRKA